jgi:cytochrome c oxidase cbb3-type subunit III
MFSSPKSLYALAPFLVALWAASAFVAFSQASPQGLPRKNVKAVSTRGKQTFASSCASCHGLDGRGGERAPNIADSPKVQRLPDSQIFRIIENGIPGNGMPAFHSLDSSNVQAVIAYLRALQGTKRALKLPGDPKHGEDVFFGKAGCSGCHMVAGKGGFIASDLSTYAGTHAMEQLRSAIIDPTPGSDPRARLVTVTTVGGGKVVGKIRNEDNFSMQLQALDGTFHFVTKSDVAMLEYSAQTLMPSDYSSTLSPDEVKDVVSYLMRVANPTGSEPATKMDDWEEQ